MEPRPIQPTQPSPPNGPVAYQPYHAPSQSQPPAPYAYQQPQHGHQSQPFTYQQPPQAGMPVPVVRQQGAWGLWWIVLLTLGIYYYVWYARINRELCAVLSRQVPADGRWWSQLIPIYCFVGLARTAKRVNAAHAAYGSPTRVSPFVAWFWATGWFASQTRYLQRRINILHSVLASRGVLGGPPPTQPH